MHDDMTEQQRDERRADKVAQAQSATGIDDAMIRRLVDTFYERVRADPLLGPVFAGWIVDWGPHLARMYEFWSSVTLHTGDYHGRPMVKHAPLPIDGGHFDRWLEIFRQTARDVCPPTAAAHFIEKAELIAQSLEMGIATSRGLMLSRTQRLPPPIADR
jgi:hemoglobin